MSYFREALGGAGSVIAANMFAHSPAMIAADHAVLVPPCYDPDYVEAVKRICQEHEISLILPLHDLDTAFLAPHADALEKLGSRLVLPSSEFVEICLDKCQTSRFLGEHGFHTCSTYSNLKDTLKDLSAGRLNYPLMLKPRMGFGSIGLHRADDEESLRLFHKIIRKEILESEIPRAGKFDLDCCVLIQEFMPGEEYGLDIVNDLSGEVVSVFVERKIAMRSGETDCAETVDHPELVALGTALGKISRHQGVLDVDVIVNGGKLVVLEMNPRFGGHYPFAHIAGANVPAALIAWRRGEDPDPFWLKPRKGVMGYKDLNICAIPSGSDEHNLSVDG